MGSNSSEEQELNPQNIANCELKTKKKSKKDMFLLLLLTNNRFMSKEYFIHNLSKTQIYVVKCLNT